MSHYEGFNFSIQRFPKAKPTQKPVSDDDRRQSDARRRIELLHDLRDAGLSLSDVL